MIVASLLWSKRIRFLFFSFVKCLSLYSWCQLVSIVRPLHYSNTLRVFHSTRWLHVFDVSLQKYIYLFLFQFHATFAIGCRSIDNQWEWGDAEEAKNHFHINQVAKRLSMKHPSWDKLFFAPFLLALWSGASTIRQDVAVSICHRWWFFSTFSPKIYVAMR